MANDGRGEKAETERAVTPDMLWPAPDQTRTRRRSRKTRAGRKNHPSDASSIVEPTLILGARDHLVDLSDCENGCGNGVWCHACRADIRAEALHWLRELNVPRPAAAGSVLSWNRAWHREILLADH